MIRTHTGAVSMPLQIVTIHLANFVFSAHLIPTRKKTIFIGSFSISASCELLCLDCLFPNLLLVPKEFRTWTLFRGEFLRMQPKSKPRTLHLSLREKCPMPVPSLLKRTKKFPLPLKIPNARLHTALGKHRTMTISRTWTLIFRNLRAPPRGGK